MLHAHIDAAGFKLADRLGQAFLLGLFLFSAVNPYQVIVALVGRAGGVITGNYLALQSGFYEIRHQLEFTA